MVGGPVDSCFLSLLFFLWYKSQMMNLQCTTPVVAAAAAAATALGCNPIWFVLLTFHDEKKYSSILVWLRGGERAHRSETDQTTIQTQSPIDSLKNQSAPGDPLYSLSPLQTQLNNLRQIKWRHLLFSFFIYLPSSFRLFFIAAIRLRGSLPFVDRATGKEITFKCISIVSLDAAAFKEWN